jgi:hypothetical protein
MQAKAEPSARFMLVCSRLASAARTAAEAAGSSTSAAIATPITARGAPTASTAVTHGENPPQKNRNIFRVEV